MQPSVEADLALSQLRLLESSGQNQFLAASLGRKTGQLSLYGGP